MTPIVAGMSPTAFINAVNANITELGTIGKNVTITNIMPAWEYISALKLNGFSGIEIGSKGATEASVINNSVSLANKVITGATDVKTFGATGDGTTDDQASINTAIAAGNIIMQNGTFKLTASIKIPSNRTIYLFNCKIKMANTSYDNFFRNSDMTNGNTTIKIIGLGNVELDGNAPNNNDSYVTYGPINTNVDNGGTPYRYNAFMWCGVTGLEISGLYLYDNPHWQIQLQKCSNVKVYDIYSDHHTLIVNQDFIDFSHSSNVEVYNIVVTCADDFSCMSSAGYNPVSWTSIVDWNKGDVYNISVHNAHIYDMANGGALVPIAGDGGKIYNINYSRILISIGGTIFYGSYTDLWTTDPVKTDIHDIVVNDIQFDVMTDGGGVPRNYAFYFGQDMMDFAATNIVNNTGKSLYTITDAADVSDNVKINGVQVT